jgi:hypothetical protein
MDRGRLFTFVVRAFSLLIMFCCWEIGLCQHIGRQKRRKPSSTLEDFNPSTGPGLDKSHHTHLVRRFVLAVAADLTA